MKLTLYLPIMSALTFLPLTLNADMGMILATLGETESNNRDTAKGRSGEISRYQIMPSVWIKYAPSPLKQADATNPIKSKTVATSIILDRCARFKLLKGRDPTPFELYALWHRPAEAYSGRYKPATRTRSQRFENLYFQLLTERNRSVKR